MRIWVHADDFGVSRGVTDSILRCADEGILDSVSAVVNRDAFDYAIGEHRRRKGIRLVLHLNWVEGRPLEPRESMGLLTDERGLFFHSFFSLWRLHALGDAARRERLEDEIRRETVAQIRRLRGAVGADLPLQVDSHRHLHLIPFVFRVLLDVARQESISCIRIIREPLVFDRSLLSAGLPFHIAKHTLLNGLCRRHRSELAARGIDHPDYFVGLLYSDRMSAGVVRAALERVRARAGRDTTLELLFHPGAAAPGEESLWDAYPAYRAFYFSPCRDDESRSLRSNELRELLDRSPSRNG